MSDSSKRWLLFGVAVIAIAILVAFLVRRFPEAMAGRDGQIDLVHSLAVLAFVGSSFILHRRLPVGHMLRYGAIWIGIGGLLVLAYSYRFEFESLGNRLVGELLPHRAQVSQGAVSIRAGAGGHFIVEAEVDGADIRFLVDTGASDVVLTPADARRLGIDLATLKFTRTYRTANGIVQGAPIRLRRIRIGDIVVDDVRASVNGAAMKRSLLGMSFLGRLRGYEVRDGQLMLRK